MSRDNQGILRKIMFVDDEYLVVELADALLTNLGFESEIFRSSALALNAFRENPNDYELLITDQIMPGLMGTELADAFLQIRPDFKIIICTGYGKGIDQDAVKRSGVKGFIPKPFTRDEFLEEIQAVLRNN